MNIFYTNDCPFICASEHNNVHQVKMILEHCQMLSAAHHLMSQDIPEGIYKLTHKNHPSSVWVRQSTQHYEWLWLQTKELCRLYTERTGKTHKTEAVLDILEKPPASLSDEGFIEPPICTSDEFKLVGDTVRAYQMYLNSKFKEWLSRERPMKVEFMTKPDWVNV